MTTFLRSCLSCLLLLLLSTLAAAGTPQTLLILNSQPGDYIGLGQYREFTPADGTFSVQTTFRNGVSVAFQNSSEFWFLDFGPPDAVKLTRGVYEGAQRFAFHGPKYPGLDVFGDGRGCNTVVGRFLISDIAVEPDNTIDRLAMDFEQHCEGAAPALYGSIRYNSDVAVTPRVSAADAIALKGSAGTSSASVILSLSMPADHAVQVHYATANGTAIAGTDYLATNGDVTFPSGTTSQTVSIPIIGSRAPRGKVQFRVQLSAPHGAPVGDGTAAVRIYDPNLPITAVTFNSQQGDYIGGGQLSVFDEGDTAFGATRNSDNGVSLAWNGADLWNADFAAPDSATLIPGVYNNAERFPFQEQGAPGLSIAGAGRGCNTLTGRFVVYQADYFSNGNVAKFSTDFEQHCEGGKPALFGSVRVNAILRQLSVTDAVIQGSSAVFTVTLNPPSTRRIKVGFQTADDTATGGTDYVNTRTIVTFESGEVEHTVTVPLLIDGHGQKRFFGELVAPGMTAIWNGKGVATF